MKNSQVINLLTLMEPVAQVYHQMDWIIEFIETINVPAYIRKNDSTLTGENILLH